MTTKDMDAYEPMLEERSQALRSGKDKGVPYKVAIRKARALVNKKKK